jgi:uncharacterized protein (DUF488 family)
MNIIYTIGYGSTPLEQRAAREQLRVFRGIAMIDTRYSPRSRFPEWCKAALEKEFAPRYVHIRALGNINYRSGGPIVLADEARGLEQARQLLEQGDILLLCGCYRVDRCHRREVAARLHGQTGAAICHLLMPLYDSVPECSPEQARQQAITRQIVPPAEQKPRRRKLKPAQDGPDLWEGVTCV